MTNILNIHKKLITKSADIFEIMQPVLQKHSLTIFNYYKHFSDGRIIRLSTHEKWLSNFLKNNYIGPALIAPEPYLKKSLNYFIWQENDFPQIVPDSAINFNIGNCISIAQKDASGIEFFGFGATASNTAIINNFYLNNFDLLEKYSLYFKEKAANIITDCIDNNLMLEINDDVIPNYKNNINTIFTDRQFDCAYLLLKGLNSREISLELNLSIRTIETHIEYLKCKLSCRNKTELIIKLYDILK